jgi:hypothetical protein
MLLNQFLPHYDFNEVHKVIVKASPEKTFAAVKALTPAELSPLVGIMLDLRGLPSRLIGHARSKLTDTEPFLDQLFKNSFFLLADESGEIVFGLIGQFWKLAGGRTVSITASDEFIHFNQTDFARVAANLRVEASGDCTILSTETRIVAPDAATRRKFAFYWRLISMGSGWIRILWLNAIKRKAEKAI